MKKSIAVEIRNEQFQRVVYAKFEEGGEWERVFGYYPDELHFLVQELLYKTKEEMLNLFTKKDIAYLQS